MTTIATSIGDERRDAGGSELELRRLLRERGHRVTSQRIVIDRALRRLDRHVTADEVHSAVTEQLPGVSLPTVYATLDLFVQLGIVRRISPGEGPLLYDPRSDDHHHLVCDRCGAVEDVDARLDVAGALAAARRKGFAPERAALAINGLCAGCARAQG